MKTLDLTEKKDIHILLCEDDENIGMLVREWLEACNLESMEYKVTLCIDGEEGLDAFCCGQYDLCILDVMMPKMDGFTLAKKIRELNTDVPIIFMTAKNQLEDEKEGFKVGADDYITKPFDMSVVLCRIEAVLRRALNNKQDNGIRQIGKFKFDISKQLLILGDQETNLTTKEAELLTLLSNKTNSLLQRNVALKTIWDNDDYFSARSMDVYITKLRKVLKADPDVEIKNIHGKGYKLIDKPSDKDA